MCSESMTANGLTVQPTELLHAGTGGREGPWRPLQGVQHQRSRLIYVVVAVHSLPWSGYTVGYSRRLKLRDEAPVLT